MQILHYSAAAAASARSSRAIIVVPQRLVIIVIIINKKQEPDTVMKERLKRPKSSSAVSLKSDVPRMATAENRQDRKGVGEKRLGNRQHRKGESTQQDSTQKRMD